jgi:general stress protein 26
MTPKASKKVKNIRNSQNIYFSVDDEEFPPKGVKGKGKVTIVEDSAKVVSSAEKL